MDLRVLRTYLDYFLPREVVGPVIIVFSLEGVIDGLFTAYVPDAYATLGWGVVFIVALSARRTESAGLAETRVNISYPP